MKKRSLVSAIAMLVISAIVLSSATYAWFSSGSAASVSTVSASVSNSDGSIVLSADGGNTWKTTITEADLTDPTTANIFPALVEGVRNFTPVSLGFTAEGVTKAGGAINDGVFAPAAAGASLIQYTVWIKASVDNTNVTVTPTFATTAAFVYSAITYGSTQKVYNATAGRAYTPVIASTGSAADTNGNDIIDAGEAPEGFLGSAVTATAAEAFNITLTANNPVAITVYVWAEGQDAACSGAVEATGATLGLSFTKVSA